MTLGETVFEREVELETEFDALAVIEGEPVNELVTLIEPDPVMEEERETDAAAV